MGGFWSRLFESGFMPHGHCYFWDPTIVWLHVLSDGFTAAAYYSIPLALLVFLRKREDIAFRGIFWLFGAFILACGTTHILSIVTLWHPIYRIEGVIKALTAGVSVVTAIVLWPLIPKALRLPSPGALADVNEELRAEIAHRRAAERELQEANELLERRVQERTQELARSNQDLEQFAYMASHDLQEPIRVIASYVQLLQRRHGAAMDAEALEFMGTIDDACRRGRALIEGLLDFSRVGRENEAMAHVDLEALVSAVVRRNTPAFEAAGGQIRARGLAGVSVEGWAGRLEQVFDNLLSNSLKYRGEAPPEVQINVRTTPTEIFVTVEDNGVGIPEEHRERVFEMFQRLDRDRNQGFGVGLATARRIAEHHGGTLTIASQTGPGASFVLQLPRGTNP